LQQTLNTSASQSYEQQAIFNKKNNSICGNCIADTCVMLKMWNSVITLTLLIFEEN